mmetsp:Transcript_6171/g.8031  ORF Transcript_6171/g.8031 Transcript_6171/m.8031 type:complete len:152 (-) Transcript_6171:171-626(-)
MMRSIVGTIGLFLLAGTAAGQNLFSVTPEETLQDVPVVIEPNTDRIAVDPNSMRIMVRPEYTKDSAVETRIGICMDQGVSAESCQCRADTSARILQESDFFEETWYLESENVGGLTDFHNRMLAEQPERMFELGEALGKCPASMMQLEEYP